MLIKPRVSLRTLLILMTFVAVCLGWWKSIDFAYNRGWSACAHSIKVSTMYDRQGVYVYVRRTPGSQDRFWYSGRLENMEVEVFPPTLPQQLGGEH